MVAVVSGVAVVVVVGGATVAGEAVVVDGAVVHGAGHRARPTPVYFAWFQVLGGPRA